MKKIYSQLLGATLGFGHDETNYILFYGGIFSQWAACTFTVPSLGGLKVNCAEQAMMLHKAKEFNDMEAYDKILNTNDPMVQKFVGRNIKNYNEKIWQEKRLEYVTAINYEKFSQNKTWKELLLLTDGYYLVEASPTDRIWGIGYSEHMADDDNKYDWGINLLGVAISMARDRIISES